MLKRISHTFIHVLDQDEALDFYLGKPGMVVHPAADLGVMRFLTVNLPDQPDVQLVLMLPGPPAYDDATAAEIRELVTKGAAGGGVIFETNDCRGTYESLRAAGVEFTQEPTERFYGTDCALRDPFWDPISGGGVIFETNDCRGTYESLRAAGVEFTQEPTERFYGTDCALRDPFGNPIRFTQPTEGPIVVPSAVGSA